MNKGHSQAGEHRWTDKSGHGKNPTGQEALTNWRAQMDEQVRTWKESNQVRAPLTPWRADKSLHENNLTEQGVLTNWKVQMNGQVRTWKGSD